MSEFMKTLLSLSVSGTLLLLLIWGFKLLYRNRFSRRWQYYIWIIAVFRFLLPFTPDTTIVGNLFEKLNAAEMTSESPASPNESMTSESRASPNEPNTMNAGYSEIERAQKDKSVPATHNSFDTYACLFWVWLASALALFIRRITIYQGFIRHMKAGNTEVSDMKALNVLSDCKEKLGIKTRVALYRNVLITSPIMTGFFRPSIILPVTELTDKELSHIFAHELNHYKQGDMFYKWLIQIVICAHWFNPFVYRMEKEVNRACELSCDEAVISVLDDSARREYGETLMKFIKINNHKNNTLASVTLTEGAEQLKERLGAIMKFRKKTRLIVAISAIAAVLLSVGGFTIGAYAAQSGAKQSSSDGEVNSGAKQSSSDGETDYKSILLGKKDFICTDLANKRLNIEEVGQAVTDEDGFTVRAVKFARIDLDGDGEDEVVLWLRVNDSSDYGFEVLHYHDGEVYGYTLPYRAFYNLKTDGTFIYSSGAAYSGIGKIKFSGTEYSIIEKDYSGAQEQKTDVKWYELSDDNINAVFM